MIEMLVLAGALALFAMGRALHDDSNAISQSIVLVVTGFAAVVVALLAVLAIVVLGGFDGPGALVNWLFGFPAAGR